MNLAKKTLLNQLFLVLVLTFAGLHSVKAQLPSSSYDDYDFEKYQDLFNRQNEVVARAQSDLQNAQNLLNQAQSREQSIGNQLNQSRNQYFAKQNDVQRLNERVQRNNETIARLRQIVSQGTSDLQTLNSQVQTNEQVVNSIQAQVNSARASLDQINAQVGPLQAQVEGIARAVAELDRAIDQSNVLIADLQTRLAAATTDEEKAQIQEQIDAENSKITGYEGQKSQLQSQGNAVNGQLISLLSRQSEATQHLTDVSSQLSQAISNRDAMIRMRDAKQNEVNTAQAQATQLDSENFNLARELERATRDLNQLQNDILNQENLLRSAQTETQQRVYERDFISSNLNTQIVQLQRAQNRLDDVARNIGQAQQVANNQANNDASSDGNREGTEIGQERGKRDGISSGLNDGKNKGTSDGRTRDYNDGYAKGKAQATADATKNSTNDAEVNGKRDGEAQGKADGLVAAYNQGREEGLAHGDLTGDDTVAYGKGRTRGEADGLAIAVEEAKAQEPIGFKTKESEYLNAKLKPIIIGDSALAQKFNGLQGSHSEPGDDRYYRPRPPQYPHPRIERFYRDYYDIVYRAVLSDTFDQVYRRVYKQYYDVNYKQAYDQAYALNYEDSRKQGYDDAYKKTYKPVYDSNYAKEYAARRAAYYKQQFDIWKLDKTEHDRGFKDGNAVASEAKGYREGKKYAYDTNIGPEKKKAYDAGVLRATNLYTNNAIIKISSIELREQDADGIFRPGETILAVVKLKNFGLVAKSDLNSVMESASGAVSIQTASVNVGQIPGQSDATVIVKAQALIPAKSKEGDSLSITLRASDAKNTFISQAFTKPVQYPTVLRISGFDGVLIPGVATNVKVTVNNRSQSKQNILVNLAIDSSKVDATNTTQTVAELAAGASKDLQFVLTGKMEARFEETGLQLTGSQNSLQFATTQVMAMTIIRRHTPTADSKGLIISANLARGGGKKLYDSEKLDTWDLRVDGSMSSTATLANYKGKILHVMGDRGSQMDAATLAQVQAFIQANGSVILWGPELDQSSISMNLQAAMGVRISKAVNVNETAAGQWILNSVRLPVQGLASIVSVGSKKAVGVLQTSQGIHAVQTGVDGIQEQTGQLLTIGVDAAELTKEQINSVMTAFEYTRSTFENKLNQAFQSPDALTHHTIQDIVTEINTADEVGGGKFYKDKGDASKFMRLAKKFIEAGKGTPQRLILSKYFMTIYNAVESISNVKEKRQLEMMLEKRIGGAFKGRSWKEVYCEANSSQQMCQAPPPGGGN